MSFSIVVGVDSYFAILLFCHFALLSPVYVVFFPYFCHWTTKQFLFPNLEESIASFIYIELGGRMEVYFSLLLFLLPLTSASCFGRDAHFKKSKAPVIVQPNRADPTKVSLFVVADFWYYLVDHLDHLCSQILVSWDQAIERPQCVDRWRTDNNTLSTATIITIINTTINSIITITRYWVRVWPEGTEMSHGGRHLVNETDQAKKQVLSRMHQVWTANLIRQTECQSWSLLKTPQQSILLIRQ